MSSNSNNIIWDPSTGSYTSSTDTILNVTDGDTCSNTSTSFCWNTEPTHRCGTCGNDEHFIHISGRELPMCLHCLANLLEGMGLSEVVKL